MAPRQGGHPHAIPRLEVRPHIHEDDLLLRRVDEQRAVEVLEPLDEPVDLIVANLPYIPTSRVPTLQPEIQYEPKVALDGGEDGLDLIRRMLSQAVGKVKEQATILLELDPEQVPAVEELTKRHFPNATTSVEQDLARLDRIFVITLGGEETD